MDKRRNWYKMEQCQYCEGVECSSPERAKCSQCGWNPKVMAERMKQLQKGKVLHNERV